ncbi:bifunctional metallophosphatase/5'-nucleotidase [Vicingus serpentipes]|uniref:Bifunctional metallophosphatase/5'-nucleotidase n=1 Tax=Vicingus serpentipes TaxID=1926625 RepID=A0A5C6RP19_9FLAO|nr:metallophosphatase [Vicingus serpentipes]TXB63675.1 bifunctional metallophosphatase/5'-nucleotidase [Vicingus serpentipes]
MSSRRQFIKQIFIAGGGLVSLHAIPFSSYALSKDEATKITILHTNDVHSHIEPFPSNDPKYPNLGGAARRAALIEKIRASEQNVLLLDAGDIFQGTPYFNKFEGEIDFKLMSLMQYDAATIGNHDFDNGIEGLQKMLPHANFPFINANYNFDNTILKGEIIPHKIFIKDNIKIGVFGVGVELDGLVSKELYKETIYNNPITIANKKAAFLKNEEHCDLVICLSHLGYEYKSNKVSDLILARETTNIDLIIGGHTHTFLTQPTEIKNNVKKRVLINQVGWAGINLGRIDFFITPNKSANYFQSSVQAIEVNF